MLEQLKQLGLSQYETRAYGTILESGLLTATDISKIAQIPQGRIYNVLSTLEQKGYCSVYPGSVKKYKATNPKIVFAELVNKKNKELEDLVDLQKNMEEKFNNSEENKLPIDYLQLLTSKQSQVSKFDDLIRMSKESLYSFNKKPYATGFKRSLDEIDRASEPLKKIINRGTEVRALFEEETEDIELFTTMVRYYESIGENARICPELPLKMLLSDCSVAMVSLRSMSKQNFKLTSMVIDHSDLTSALVELFELYWSKSISLDEFLKNIKK